MRRNIVSILMIILCMGIIGFGLYLVFHPEPEGEARQQKEEQLADAYLQALNTSSSMNPSDSSDIPKETGSAEEGNWSDDIYYTRDGVTYTPDYAKGKLDAVLQIDSAKIHRGVYTGNWEEIQYDLDIWMVTCARPDLVLGKTRYVIYGHNHTVQDLSFNKLKNVKVGEYFTLTNDEGVYFYRVTNFSADWREDVTKNIVDNESLPADKCYILTCGRDEYRYKDIILEGTLEKVYTLAEWNQEDVQKKVKEEKDAAVSLAEVDETLANPENNLSWSISLTDPKKISVSVIKADGTKDVGAEIGLFNEDGITLTYQDSDGKEHPYRWTQTSDDYILQNLSQGNYVIGLFKGSSENYNAPLDQQLTIKDRSVSADEVGHENEIFSINPKIIAIGGIGIFALILMAILVICFIRKKRI